MPESATRSGARILVDTLVGQGADHLFCVPGESYLAVLDALHDTPALATTVCRQEGGAAMMADAYGKLTGRPGLCFVTRGPGAANASIGVHIAFQDSTPMILFVGQVARGVVEREAFQEVEYRHMFAPLAKWVGVIDRADRVPEFLGRAFATATSGRPGPVVLVLPEDMLTERAVAPDIACWQELEIHPGAPSMDALAKRLRESRRPFVLVGGRGWDEPAREGLRTFAETWRLPVAATFRCQDIMDNSHDNYVGDVGIGINPKLAERVEASDLLLVLGARLGEMTTSGYSLIESPRPRQPLVHVHPGAEELGRVYQPALAINATMPAMAAALSALAPPSEVAWLEELCRAREDYLAWSTPTVCPGPVQMGEIMSFLRKRLPPETVICNGAGNYTAWVHRFYRFRHGRTQLAPTAGAMGYGVPAAVAAKRLYPDRPVVAFAGDGCFLMNGQELATAVKYGLGIVIIVVNNGMYGTIRMHQERKYPGRVHGTDLSNPDFAALARSYGAFGAVVERTEDFAPAFEEARRAGGPALIELRIDAEAITPRETLSEIRRAAISGAKSGAPE